MLSLISILLVVAAIAFARRGKRTQVVPLLLTSDAASARRPRKSAVVIQFPVRVRRASGRPQQNREHVVCDLLRLPRKP